MNRIFERPLLPGRGRVYLHDGWWKADYRAYDCTLYGATAIEPADAYLWITDWIHTKAMEATK